MRVQTAAILQSWLLSLTSRGQLWISGQADVHVIPRQLVRYIRIAVHTPEKMPHMIQTPYVTRLDPALLHLVVPFITCYYTRL